MREESHLDEMRDAIRGDFERLAERRGEQDLMRVTDDEEITATAEPEPEPELQPHQEPRAEPEPEQPPEVESEPEEPERRSWLARLFPP